MGKNSLWTPQEESILLDNIGMYPYNLQESFRKTSVEIDRTVAAISMHWYKNLRLRSMRSNKVFMTVGARRNAVNTKVIREGTLNNSKPSPIFFWKKFLTLLKKCKLK